MRLLAYNLLLALLFPVILLYLAWRLFKGKEDPDHRGERWGRLPEGIARDPRTPRFWVHCVSVGELMAAVPVLRELRRRFPDALIVVSTITRGGREVALKQTPPADEVVYFPLDFFWAAQRALAVVRPDALLLMEWEIWPNFLTAAKRRGTKIAVLNGRVSDRGLRRGQRGAFFTKPGLDAVDLFAMQSDEDSRRAALVGADPARVATFGNTKFDEAATPLKETERAALRADLGIPPDAPVWVCGSTRPGEEAIIADAYQRARQTLPGLYLLVAPRHIERAGEVVSLFAAAGLAVRRRSARDAAADSSVLLLDTFGELGRVYAVAQVAFIGGSLLPFGGQSVFQPLAQGTPALFGPYMNNQRDIAALAQSEGVGFPVTDAETLAAEVVRLATLSETEKGEIGRKARTLIERNQGVAARCVEAVARLLEPSDRGG